MTGLRLDGAGSPLADADDRWLLHRRLSSVAAAAGAALAVRDRDGSISYADLDRRSAQVATVLRGCGVGPDRAVAVLLDKSIDAVVLAVAAWKAGGAYLPLDADTPPARVAAALDRMPAGSVLVTDAGRSAAYPDHRPLDVRSLHELADRADAVPVAVAVRPDHLAYVVHTSGSTGVPKAVGVSHRSLSVAFEAWDSALSLSKLDSHVQIAGLGFDVHVGDLARALLSGAALLLCDRMTALDPVALHRLITTERAAAMLITPSVLRLLLDHLDASGGSLTSLRQVAVGGEAWTIEDYRRLRRAVGSQARIVNFYGLAETTVDSMFHEVRDDDESIPLGRAFAGWRVPLLDADLRPVAAGDVGEIYVAGTALARGYLGDPAATADRFVPDPDGPPGSRMYRTADLARRDDRGESTYVGRSDDQVKVRGVRVQIGDVEWTLSRHPGVRRAAVAAAHRAGETRLTAYVVPAGDRDGLVGELHGYATRMLPPAMVPTATVLLDALPLGPTGKVDRAALRSLARLDAAVVTSTADSDAVAASGPDPAPAGPAAPEWPHAAIEAVARAWADVLGSVPRHFEEDLFASGGSSLTAARLAVRLAVDLDLDISVGDVFAAPTVIGMARTVAAAGRRSGGVHDPARTSAPATPDQQRMWLIQQLNPQDTAYHVPAVVRLRGQVNLAALRGALDLLVNRHEALRCGLRPGPDGLTLWSTPIVRLPLTEIDLTGAGDAAPGRAADAALDCAREPFDLGTPPLWRARLLRIDTQTCDLVLVGHHLVADGRSMRVLLTELGQAYSALDRGQRPAWAPVRLRLIDLAGDIAAGPTASPAGRAYWRAAMSGIPAPAPLPAAAPAGNGAGRHAETLPARVVAAVRAAGRGHGGTPFAVMVSALAVVLARWTGEQDVVIGTPFGHRDRPDTEDLVGLLVSTLALRIPVPDGITIGGLLDRAVATVASAGTHRDVPFDVVVSDLGRSGGSSRAGLFRVWLNLLGRPPEPPNMVGLTTEVRPAPVPDALFDLSIYLTERDDVYDIEVVHDRAVVDAEHAVALLQQFITVIEQLCGDPAGSVDALRLGPAPVAPQPLGTPVDGTALLRRPLAAARNAVALRTPAGSVTYHDLLGRVAYLRERLRAGGVGPADPVALLAHRDAGLVTGLLAALGCGATVAVLDPAAPPDRLVDQIRLLGPTALIYTGPVPPAIAAEIPVRMDAGTAAVDDPPPSGELTDLAPCGGAGFATFTSGTTGAPRAVRAGTGPVAHFVDWYARTFAIDATDRFALLAGLGYDPLLRDVFVPLCTGGTLCIPPPGLSPRQLSRWLASVEVTVLHLTPGTVRLLAAGSGPAVPSVRLVVSGGDILTGADRSRIAAWAPAARVINGYGTTETPQLASWYEPDAGGADDAQTPIGRGCPGWELLVLDPSGRRAAVGERGHVVARSPYLADGYLGDPAGADGFGPDPVPGHRRFDTGDLGRYRPDGAVTLAGRSDGQLKIHGYRVELAEVEHWLREDPRVRDCAVAASDRADGERQLVAYLVPASGAVPSLVEVRASLRHRLPAPMLPAAVVELAALPLTARGKLDRAALPPPQRSAGEDRIRDDRPVALEAIVGDVWRELLGVAAVPPERNFFDLGATSLLMVQAQAMLVGRLSRPVPISLLFEHPNVRELAAHLDYASPGSGGPRRRPVRSRLVPDMRERRLAARRTQRPKETD